MATRFALQRIPRPRSLLLLRVSALRLPPREAVRGLGIRPEDAEGQLILARSMLRPVRFERAGPRS